MVNLGDRVKDTVSGFSGIAVAKVSYLHGCTRIGVQAPTKNNKKPEDPQYFDEPQLKIVKRKALDIGNNKIGGYKQDVPSKTF